MADKNQISQETIENIALAAMFFILLSLVLAPEAWAMAFGTLKTIDMRIIAAFLGAVFATFGAVFVSSISIRRDHQRRDEEIELESNLKRRKIASAGVTELLILQTLVIACSVHAERELKNTDGSSNSHSQRLRSFTRDIKDLTQFKFNQQVFNLISDEGNQIALAELHLQLLFIGNQYRRWESVLLSSGPNTYEEILEKCYKGTLKSVNELEPHIDAMRISLFDLRDRPQLKPSIDV